MLYDLRTQLQLIDAAGQLLDAIYAQVVAEAATIGDLEDEKRRVLVGTAGDLRAAIRYTADARLATRQMIGPRTGGAAARQPDWALDA